MRTRPCDAEVRRGRTRKAVQFIEAANLIRDLTDEDEDIVDAYVTLCVHAGIAAADAICCARLAEHAQGDSHRDAIDLLGRADRELAKQLETLLALKTKAGYSHLPATPAEFKRAGRAAEALVEAARSL